MSERGKNLFNVIILLLTVHSQTLPLAQAVLMEVGFLLWKQKGKRVRARREKVARMNNVRINILDILQCP